MPYLYCAAHGRDRENGLIAAQEDLREAGESVLVVNGKLTSGPWLCDKCNATLRRGDAATLLVTYLSSDTGFLYDYEFAYERHYFAMRGKDAVTVYGAPWPGGDVAGMMLRARSG